MKALTAGELLRAWELGIVRRPVERALAILAATEPGASIDDLGRLPLGDRDARLRALREATFGPRYQALVSCPACGESLELGFDAEDVPPAPRSGDGSAPASLRLGDYILEVRPLDSTDLAAAARCPDVATAREVLARRCIVAAQREGFPVAADAIAADVLPELAAHLEAADPGADVTLEVTCSGCDAQWDPAFDIATYLWTEIEAEALRLLRDVYGLARGYGWCEADILAMSPLRRRAYLELVEA